MNTDLDATLAAAKNLRRDEASHVEGLARYIEIERKSLPALEVQLAQLAAARGNAIALSERDNVLRIDKDIALVQIDIEISHERIKNVGAEHTEALTALVEVQEAVRLAAQAVAGAERDVIARKFVVAMDRAEELGRVLDNFTGPRTNLPSYIELALSRLPKRDELYTPVNVLRAGGYRSQRAWDERIQELMRDDTDKIRADSQVSCDQC